VAAFSPKSAAALACERAMRDEAAEALDGAGFSGADIWNVERDHRRRLVVLFTHFQRAKTAVFNERGLVELHHGFVVI
jgi:hypothetical protein